MRTRINLEVTEEPTSNATRDRKQKVTVEQSFLDEFDRVYAENCDQKLTRLKNRNVSKDSSFDPRNKPPQQYLDEERVAAAPNKTTINLMDYEMNKRSKLAGKLTTLNTQILDHGPQ